ncbi:hypothetical protein M3Y99_01510900 [Aphelenchoides fujianensis]|nr:hypothetical protein M3Y99_01510900 [Aphelenchoides fujianensis]
MCSWQNLSFVVDTSSWYGVLSVYPADQGGSYDPAASSTFKRGPDLRQSNVTIGKDVLLKDAPFDVLYEFSTNTLDFTGYLGLYRTKDNSSIIQYALEQMDVKVVTFAFDKLSILDPGGNEGVMVIGGRAPDHCADDWIFVPEYLGTGTGEQWALELDEFSFGTMTFDSPGYISFWSYYEDVIFPVNYKDTLQAALKADDRWNVPCDATLEISFRIAGHDIVLLPEDYLVRYDDDTCLVAFGFTGDRRFRVSYSFMQKHCFLYDYAHAQVGFASRLAA